MTLCMDRFARFEFITHSNAFFHSPMRGRQQDGKRKRDASSEVEWSACTCHGQSNNSINLLHKSMRYWQYDDEADWLNGSTRDDRRRASSSSSTSFSDHHRWLALCRNCRGQNLNSNLTLTKVHQVEVLQSESKSKMEVELELKLELELSVLACGQPQTQHQQQTMPGLFLLYLAESIIILSCLKLITFP